MSEGNQPRLRAGRLLVALGLAVALFLLLSRWGAGLYVEYLWFSAEDYGSVFWRQALWTWGVRIVAGLATAALVYLNLRIVAETLGGIQIRRKFGDLEIQEQLPDLYVQLSAVAIALFCGFWFGASVPGEAGYRAMLLVHGEAWGQTDPFLGRDLGYYVFQLPVLSGLLTFGLVLSLFLFALSAGGYALTGAVRWRRNRLEMDGMSMPHLASLGALFLLLLGLRYLLARHQLLLDGNSGVQSIFGYADAMARMPGYALVAVLAVAAAAMVLWGGIRRNLLPPAAGVTFFVVGALVAGELYPHLIQRFRVEPNELERETRYIDANIAYTWEGFDLSELSRAAYPYEPPSSEDWEQAQERMAGFPIWTPETLLTTFRQVEARFRYYDFAEVTVDRYRTPEGGIRPVAVSAREVDPNGIPDPNWQNLHLRERYITGMGAVAADATTHDPGGRLDMFLRGIPPEFSGGDEAPQDLRLERSSVFVGVRPQLHAIVNPTEENFLAPDGSPGEAGVDFPGGIQLSSLARTGALAWRFQDANLLFASEIQSTSRFVFRRRVQDRVQAVAPFLRYPEAPYPVVVDGQIVWILEGLTATRDFPLSAPHSVGDGPPASYLRNSVKVAVDAVTGEMSFYAVEPDDPLLQAYSAAFPGLFRPMEEAPERLVEHFRYSRGFFNSQNAVLTRYHQEAPPVFHGQQDRWELATQLGAGGTPVTYRPEYGVFRLPGEEEDTYNLSTVFVPQGRRMLAGYMAARWDPGNGGQLFLYDLPVEDQVAGPRQVEALVEQDPEISQQFSLWRQGGSQVWTGHMHLVPVGNTLLYMEVVFLAADEDAIPEIRRYIVSDGRRVEMATSLEAAIEGLEAATPLLALPVLDVEGPAPLEEDPAPPPPAAMPDAIGSQEALELLEEAEERLRAGDWEGFGRAWEDLRTVLNQLAGTGGD